MADGGVRTLTSWRDPLFICGTQYHSGLHLPIFPYLYEGPGISKNWNPPPACFSSLIWAGICSVALEYLLCIPFMETVGEEKNFSSTFLCSVPGAWELN